jgi:hypothetical protein
MTAKKAAPKKRKQRPGVNAWRPAFLTALERTGNVAASCHASGTSRQNAYKAKRTDRAFALAWEDALEIAVELLEAEARRRAMSVSDTLLIFLLKAHKPGMYREKMDLRFYSAEATKIADEYDLDPADVLEEAQRMLKDA